MPPAFNLSQDQTLQFDLFCLSSALLPNSPRLVPPRAFRLFPSVRLSQHCPRLAPAQGSALAFESPRLSAVFCKRSLLHPRSPGLRSAKPATLAQLSCENQPFSYFFSQTPPSSSLSWLSITHRPGLPGLLARGGDCSMVANEKTALGRSFRLLAAHPLQTANGGCRSGCGLMRVRRPKPGL